MYYGDVYFKFSGWFDDIRTIVFSILDLCFGGCGEVRFQGSKYEIDLDHCIAFCQSDRAICLFWLGKKPKRITPSQQLL